MADNLIRDANGQVIGELRDNQDPNFPQRFYEDEFGNRKVLVEELVEAPVAEEPVEEVQ